MRARLAESVQSPEPGAVHKIGPQSHVWRPMARHPLPAVGDQLGLASIESWPAAGGGLLVGIAEPGLAGAAPLRSAIKTLFLRVDRSDAVCLIVPYAAVEQEVSLCMATLVAQELRLPADRVALDIMVNRRVHAIGFHDARRPLVDLGRDAERSISACAAVARLLLTEAAAQVWGASCEDCRVEAGLVHLAGSRLALRYGEVAHVAALMPLPGYVQIGS
jgi:hypothetical protein